MKVIVEIPEIHKSVREIEVPDDATASEIRELAAEHAGNAPELQLEYDDMRPVCEWTIRTEDGNFIP